MTFFKSLVFLVFILSIGLISCQKEINITSDNSPIRRKATILLPTKTNPFSLRNVEKAKATLALKNQDALRNSANRTAGNEPQFVYFKFSPDDLTTELVEALENDSTVQLMEIPFANMAIYGDDFALDEAKAEQIKDGSIYGVTTIANSALFSKLTARAQTQTVYLDTLVQVAEEDTTLQFQSLREAGISEEEIARFRICLFKKTSWLCELLG